MTDDQKKEKDLSDFLEGKVDFGSVPVEYELNEYQKKIAAMSMGINAALVQFVLEGIIPQNQQMHFMSHLQDFTARLYSGESMAFEDTKQTLQINSKAGNLFYEAAEEALKNGHENYLKLREYQEKILQAAGEQTFQRPTVDASDEDKAAYELATIKPTLN